jgi:hypothetical protein
MDEEIRRLRSFVDVIRRYRWKKKRREKKSSDNEFSAAEHWLGGENWCVHSTMERRLRRRLDQNRGSEFDRRRLALYDAVKEKKGYDKAENGILYGPQVGYLLLRARHWGTWRNLEEFTKNLKTIIFS